MTKMLITVFFEIRNWKQSKCPSIGEWIKWIHKTCIYIYTMEFYVVINMNELGLDLSN